MIDTSTPRRRHLWPVVAAVTAVLLIGVGVAVGLLIQRPNPVAVPGGLSFSDLAASQAALPKCADVFRPGQAIDKAKADSGCLDPDGGAHFGGGHRCNDGRRLYSMEEATGAPRGFGFSGGAYTVITGEIGADPGYGAAYEACFD